MASETRKENRIYPLAKRLLTLLLSLTFLVGAGGCMKKKDVVEEMLQYMRDKYNEEFTYVSCLDDGIYRRPTTTICVEPAKFPGEWVNVSRFKSDGEMYDGYLALKINTEVEKEISAVVSEVYGENKVFNNAQTVANDEYDSPDMSASEFLRLAPGITDARIFVTKDAADKDKDVEVFRQALKSKGYYLAFSLVYINEEAFPSLDEKTGDQYYGRYVSASNASPVTMAGEFRISKSFEFSLAHWL